MVQREPDQELLDLGWEARVCPPFGEFDFVYRKPGTYGWFDRAGAFRHDSSGAPPQYPTELMPPAEMLGSLLITKPNDIKES